MRKALCNFVELEHDEKCGGYIIRMLAHED